MFVFMLILALSVEFAFNIIMVTTPIAESIVENARYYNVHCESCKTTAAQTDQNQHDSGGSIQNHLDEVSIRWKSMPRRILQDTKILVVSNVNHGWSLT